MNIKVVGIDIAKSVFQVCVLLHDNKVAWNRKITRSDLMKKLSQLPESTLIAMEACASSHHWARQMKQHGFEVMLIPAQFVKPFVGHQKNDANDARAICEASQRPDVHSVQVKTIEQQDIKALRNVRQRLVDNRIALVNQSRAMAAEYGVIFPKHVTKFQELLPLAIEDASNQLSHVMRRLLLENYDELKQLNRDIQQVEHDLLELCKTNHRFKTLQEVPGFGPIISSALISELGTGKQFSNGRQFSAWCGLVPKQHSSGGKSCLKGITKNGNKQLRTLILHGARAVVRYADKRQDKMGTWLRELMARRGKVKAVVALANKLCRIGWRLLSSGEQFDVNKAFA
ncbi:IS110 family transposase [Vibrio sp. 1942]|uniref:IS110 family transposase n=1 Tax=Vibrio sp. 1942 TaxID=3074583 RepID=UPI0029653D89|nr:IS110 family transposase [Vibrio sp. 1942]MDW2158883.1 IS110 family transposase [Vibrio sp. 1942]